MPHGVPARPALATSPSLAHHVAPLIEKSGTPPSCPFHSPPSCSLALVLSPAALGPRSAGAPWLPRQSHAPSTLAAWHLQPSEHPAPHPSSTSSRHPPASEAPESTAAGATVAAAACLRGLATAGHLGPSRAAPCVRVGSLVLHRHFPDAGMAPNDQSRKLRRPPLL